jgi:hypothetical protein
MFILHQTIRPRPLTAPRRSALINFTCLRNQAPYGRGSMHQSHQGIRFLHQAESFHIPWFNPCSSSHPRLWVYVSALLWSSNSFSGCSEHCLYGSWWCHIQGDGLQTVSRTCLSRVHWQFPWSSPCRMRILFRFACSRFPFGWGNSPYFASY